MKNTLNKDNAHLITGPIETELSYSKRKKMDELLQQIMLPNPNWPDEFTTIKNYYENPSKIHQLDIREDQYSDVRLIIKMAVYTSIKNYLEMKKNQKLKKKLGECLKYLRAELRKMPKTINIPRENHEFEKGFFIIGISLISFLCVTFFILFMSLLINKKDGQAWTHFKNLIENQLFRYFFTDYIIIAGCCFLFSYILKSFKPPMIQLIGSHEVAKRYKLEEHVTTEEKIENSKASKMKMKIQ